jgi:hypothetical protein
LGKLLIPILLELRMQVTEREKEYWMAKDLHLFNVMNNVKDNGELPLDW